MKKPPVSNKYAIMEYTVRSTYGESLQEACFSYPENQYEEQGELREELDTWLEEEQESNGLPVSFYSLSEVKESVAKKKYGKRINSI